jgi:NAD-dependent dihydropyrimidine dehydrogenase PreA subunit
MATITRKIIRIDEDKCNGCGQCVTACHEGALQLIDGKARLVREDFCDGLGACIGECPTGALVIEEREAVAFDEAAVEASQPPQVTPAACPGIAAFSMPCGCPSAQAKTLAPQTAAGGPGQPSALRNWPTQLTLVPIQAPYLQDAHLLLSADCVPFAYGAFHRDLLPGKVVLQACPKLDDAAFYRDKLTAIFEANDIASITVTRMEVPCCGGLTAIVRDALAASGKRIPCEVITIGIGGDVLDRQTI